MIAVVRTTGRRCSTRASRVCCASIRCADRASPTSWIACSRRARVRTHTTSTTTARYRPRCTAQPASRTSRGSRPRCSPGARVPTTTRLYHAAEVSDLTCLKLVLEARPDPARVSYCMRRMLDFQNEAGVRLFLDHGADPRLPLRFGLRPQVQQALVVSGRASTITALLDRGADP